MNKLSAYRTEIIFVVLLCLLAFFLRSYALYRDLIFAFDQGRDAWEMVKISQGDFTLIGPVTGLAGVFLGPFWYYFIYPWYVVGNGNPHVAALGMSLLHALTAGAVYLFARRIAGSFAGGIAAILFTFSFSNIMFARWLSNPTPLPFFSLLYFFLVWQSFTTKRLFYFGVAGVVIGLCLQLEAANAVWYLPATALIFLSELFSTRKKSASQSLPTQLLPYIWSAVCMGIGFSLTLLPQLLFELKWNFLITKNLITAFQTTHSISLTESVPQRIPLLFSLYAKGLFPKVPVLFAAFLGFCAVLSYGIRSSLFSNRGFRIVAIWFAVPLFFHILYTGNYGNFWDYYIIAQHTALYILLASIIGLAAKSIQWRKIVLALTALFVILSVITNLKEWQGFLTPYEDRFSFQMQVDAVNWILDDAKGEKFGSWIYTPDAQDQAHRYVYYWIGQRRGTLPQEHAEQQSYIYLIVEDDVWNPKRREEWINEKTVKFGPVVASQDFGAITVLKIENRFADAKGVQ